MWVLRFNRIETKDYNHIKRVFDKIGFTSKISGIIFVKALFFHTLQKKTWRNIALNLNCSHSTIYNFFNNFKNNNEVKNIFFYFADRKIIVFINNNIKNFSNYDLDKNEIFLKNTKKELEKIFSINS